MRRILTNEEYAGTLVYNRTTQKLRTPSRHNPPDQWVKTADAFAPVVDRAVFDAAQRALAAAAARYEPAAIIERLGHLVREHAEVRPSFLRADAETFRLAAAKALLPQHPVAFTRADGASSAERLAVTGWLADGVPQPCASSSVLRQFRGRLNRLVGSYLLERGP